ncbi:MAG: serine/threonine protein kinase [Polyangiaceae bacterium]|nr:serine/threonine protein kinase [Polyangiaceae bacterium]
MSDDTLLRGRVISNRYKLVAPIGSGAMGVVWRAEDTRLSSFVAVKLLLHHVAADPEIEARFLREGRASASIRGAHVVDVFDFGIDDGTPFIAMELLKGESLKACLDRENVLPEKRTIRILSQVAKGVGRAHSRGVVHRDLKPANIFLTVDEDGETAKVLDFGLAKLTHEVSTQSLVTETGAVMGTALYMSPEQARGRTDVDHRADLWALAIITYQCLTGRLPLTGRTEADLLVKICTEPMPIPSRINPNLPKGFDEWFACGTRRSPDDRFQSAAELAEALRAAFTPAGL